jgi:hypothetical protein
LVVTVFLQLLCSFLFQEKRKYPCCFVFKSLKILILKNLLKTSKCQTGESVLNVAWRSFKVSICSFLSRLCTSMLMIVHSAVYFENTVICNVCLYIKLFQVFRMAWAHPFPSWEHCHMCISMSFLVIFTVNNDLKPMLLALTHLGNLLRAPNGTTEELWKHQGQSLHPEQLHKVEQAVHSQGSHTRAANDSVIWIMTRGNAFEFIQKTILLLIDIRWIGTRLWLVLMLIY